MSYLLTTQTPASPDEFARIDAVIGDEWPAGLLSRHQGETELGVVVSTLWASKADADRFFVERLRPAVDQVGASEPTAAHVSIGFEVTQELAKP
jgi:hypothetical protein